MNKTAAFLLLLLLSSTCFAADFSASLRIKSGDVNIDACLTNINTRAKTPAGATQVRTELRQDYGLSDKQIAFLGKKGYTLAEIHYLASLSKTSGKSIDHIAGLHNSGVGWGQLAHKLGVRPDALRKQVVARKKANKMKKIGPAPLKAKPLKLHPAGKGKAKGRGR